MKEPRKSLRPIIIVSHSTGLLPLNWDFEIDTKWGCYCSFVMLAVVLAGIYREYLRGVRIISSFTNYFTNNVTALVCVASTVFNRAKIRSYLTSSDDIFDQFLDLGFRPKYSYKRNLSEVKYMVALSIYIYVMEIYAYQADIKAALIFSVYNIWDFVSLAKMLEFAHMVRISTGCLSLINRYVKKRKIHTRGQAEQIRFGKLVKIFHDIHMNCRLLNAAYSAPLFVLSASGFICLLIDAYHATYNLTNSLQDAKRELDFIHFIARMIWVAYRIGKLYYLANVCCSIKSEARTFTVEMREFLAAADPAQIKENEELIRTHQLLFRDAVFTASGYYDVDFTMILSVVSAVGSYLVILIQLGSSRYKTSPNPTAVTTSPLSTPDPNLFHNISLIQADLHH